MLWILLAAQLNAVAVDDHLADVRGLFSVEDFPAYLVRAGEELSRTVYTRTTVRDDGTLENCAIEVSSGDPKLDAYTCALIAKRAKVSRVKWIDGAPAYSVLRFPVSWRMTSLNPPPEKRLGEMNPDLELSVSRLPNGAHKIVDFTLEVRANEKGQILSCGELPRRKNDASRDFPELIPTVCDQAKKSLVLRPPLNPSGKPVRSVQTAYVQLKLDH